jgi:hypothetical protein
VGETLVLSSSFDNCCLPPGSAFGCIERTFPGSPTSCCRSIALRSSCTVASGIGMQDVDSRQLRGPTRSSGSRSWRPTVSGIDETSKHCNEAAGEYLKSGSVQHAFWSPHCSRRSSRGSCGRPMSSRPLNLVRGNQSAKRPLGRLMVEIRRLGPCCCSRSLAP